MSDLAEDLLKLSRTHSEKKQFGRERKTGYEGRMIGGTILAISVIGDFLITFGALVISFSEQIRPTLSALGITTFAASVWGYPLLGATGVVGMMAHLQVYEKPRLLRFRQVSFLVLKTCFYWLVVLLCVTRLLEVDPLISRSYAIVATLVLAAALLIWRLLLYRISSRASFSCYMRDRILFVGWNELSDRFTRFVLNDPNRAYSLVGCVPSSRNTYETEPPEEIPHLAAYGDLRGMLRTEYIDMVILADRNASMQEIDSLAVICEKELVQFKVIPSYFQILVTGLSLQTISGIPILGISQLPLDRPFSRIIKRVVDIVGAIVGLILSAPLIAIFGALVYWESPGPIFYRQKRLGKNGATFEIIKIRSMRLDAEVESGVRWAQKNDPRKLKIGGMMRAWNIDEVPQFWNVLKGEMSLVGPRPERPELIKNFKEEIVHYNARLTAKPGLTGWAAVNGFRGDTDLVERIRCDLYYLENWSLWLDIQIMILTFFRREGAG